MGMVRVVFLRVALAGPADETALRAWRAAIDVD